jgi:hypothetical protein
MSEFVWDQQSVAEFAQSIYTEFINGRLVSFDAKIYAEKFKASKQPKPEWEIVSFWCNNALFEWDAEKDGHYVKHEHRWTRTTAYTPKHCTIRTVKRLSDGEVFTVGDIILDPNKGYSVEITSLQLAYTLLVYHGDMGWRLKDVHRAAQQAIKEVVLLTPAQIEKLKTLLND